MSSDIFFFDGLNRLAVSPGELQVDSLLTAKGGKTPALLAVQVPTIFGDSNQSSLC